MHLAVVDDEPQIRESIMHKIPWKQYGFEQVSGAASAEEALELLRKNPVDVCLCDIRMTGKSGLDLIEFASREQLKTRFIILSGYGNFSYAQQALRLGASDYLLKPCAPSGRPPEIVILNPRKPISPKITPGISRFRPSRRSFISPPPT